MTSSPDRKIEYKTAEELDRLYAQYGFDSVLQKCHRRVIVNGTYSPSKLSRPETIGELGEVFTDSTGIRAVIFHYTHTDKRVVRSIKRLVTDTADYRLPAIPWTAGR